MSCGRRIAAGPPIRHWWLHQSGSLPRPRLPIRGIRSEVELGREHGLPEVCAINCDNVITIPLDVLDDEPVGRLDEVSRARLDQALRYALDTVY